MVFLINDFVKWIIAVKEPREESSGHIIEELPVVLELRLEETHMHRSDVLVDEVSHHRHYDGLWEMVELFVVPQEIYSVIPIEVVDILGHFLH